MTPAETATILRQLHGWLKGGTQWAPTRGAEAVEAAVEMIERVAKLDPQPCFPARDHNWYYAQGWNDCIKEVMEEPK